MFKFKSLTGAVSLLILAVLTMGNQQCQETPAARQLKKNVMILGVSASDFLDNAGFNFSQVAQSQFSGVLFDSDAFYERTVYPTAAGAVVALPGTGSQKVALAEKSMQQLKTWFPTLKTSDMPLTGESACFVTRPQHLLGVKINALEAYAGGALQFGFNQTVTQVPIGLKIKIDQMRMDLSSLAIDPWTSQKIAAVNSSVKKTDYSVGFGIDIGAIHIGPEFYRVSGLAETTLKGLKQAMTDLKKTISEAQRQEWQSHVLLSRDNYVVIVGGAELGLQAGDQLKIENEVHDWTGEPCADGSVLTGSISVTADPWIVQIEDAGNLLSKAKVLNVKENESINVGALVRVSKLYVPPPPPKK
jgi:hypothetical protein